MTNIELGNGFVAESEFKHQTYIQPELPLITVDFVTDGQTADIQAWPIKSLPLPRFNSKGEADGYDWTAYV